MPDMATLAAHWAMAKPAAEVVPEREGAGVRICRKTSHASAQQSSKHDEYSGFAATAWAMQRKNGEAQEVQLIGPRG